VEYGALLLAGRAAQSRRQPPAASQRVHLALLARPGLLTALLRAYRRLHGILPRRWRTLPRPPPPTGSLPKTGADAAVFVGCVAGIYEAPLRRALLGLAQAADLELHAPEGQRCCGAAAAHAGDEAGAAALAARNRAAFAGAARVLCLASGCQSSLADSLAGIAPVEDASVALAARADRLRFRDAGGRRIAWHRPCTSFALPGSIAATRALLARVPGLELVELPDTGCCGAAGLHMREFPERAARLREPLLECFAQSGAVELLSANMGCRLHLANALALPVRHPLEFLADHLIA
jgi:glycolate oxidase iron-sulfur subunit